MKASHEGPSDLATHQNPYDDMADARENVTEMASDYIDVTSEAASILAGDVVASQAFDMLDEQVLSSQLSNYPTVRKGINVLGPGAVGVAVFSMTDNSVLQGIAIGHGLTTVRRAVEEGLDYVGATGGGSDSSTSGRLPASADSLSGRRLAEPGMNAAATTTGADSGGTTMVQGG